MAHSLGGGALDPEGVGATPRDTTTSNQRIAGAGRLVVWYPLRPGALSSAARPGRAGSRPTSGLINAHHRVDRDVPRVRTWPRSGGGRAYLVKPKMCINHAADAKKATAVKQTLR